MRDEEELRREAQLNGSRNKLSNRIEHLQLIQAYDPNCRQRIRFEASISDSLKIYHYCENNNTSLSKLCREAVLAHIDKQDIKIQSTMAVEDE